MPTCLKTGRSRSSKTTIPARHEAKIPRLHRKNGAVNHGLSPGRNHSIDGGDGFIDQAAPCGTALISHHQAFKLCMIPASRDGSPGFTTYDEAPSL